MSDTVKITNLPDSGSKERVAYDLAVKIGFTEEAPKNRAYWLDLYHRCLSVVSGIPPSNY